jgi:hypothetical protein
MKEVEKKFKVIFNKINTMNYKYIALTIFIGSILFLILFKNQVLSEYIKTIIISLCINLISSIIIIYMIDLKKEKESKNKLEKKRNIIYKKLIIPIRNYNNLIYNMYKSTTLKDNVDYSIFEFNNINTKKIFDSISLIDIESKGYTYDIYKKRKSLWKEDIINGTLLYINELEDFYNNNLVELDNELTELLCEIISYKYIKNVCNQILYLKAQISSKDLLNILAVENIFVKTNKIIKKIEPYVDLSMLSLDKNIMNKDNISPEFGSSIKK